MLTPRSLLTPIRLPFNPPLAGGTCATGSSGIVVMNDNVAPWSRPFSCISTVEVAASLALRLLRTAWACRPWRSVDPYRRALRQKHPRVGILVLVQYLPAHRLNLRPCNDNSTEHCREANNRCSETDNAARG